MITSLMKGIDFLLNRKSLKNVSPLHLNIICVAYAFISIVIKSIYEEYYIGNPEF